MDAIQQDLEICQGDDFRIRLNIKDDEGESLDLTGYTFEGQIRRDYLTSDIAGDFDIVARDQTLHKGDVDLHLAPMELDQEILELTNRAIYVYDIKMVTQGGDRKTVIRGRAYIYPQVSR